MRDGQPKEGGTPNGQSSEARSRGARHHGPTDGAQPADSPHVEAVYAGPDGAFEALRPGWLAIDTSSISPRVSRELAARAAAVGAELLDAPVSGGDKGAIAGTLSIMVGGSDAGFARALPILQAMGKTIVSCGPAGAGQVVKLANQVVVAIVIDAVSEALVLGSKAGVDPVGCERVRS